MTEVFDPTGNSDSGTKALEEEVRELRARLEQYEGEKIHHHDFGGEAPRYRLNENCYLEDDTLHFEGEEIEYLNQPNMSMVPLNEPAKRKLEEYIEALTRGAREDAERRGRPFTGLITDKGTLIAQAMQDARRAPEKVVIAMPEIKGDVPAMPHTPEAQSIKRRRGRPPKERAVVSAKAPPAPTPNGPKPAPILGSRYERASGEGSVG